MGPPPPIRQYQESILPPQYLDRVLEDINLLHFLREWLWHWLLHFLEVAKLRLCLLLDAAQPLESFSGQHLQR